MKPDPAIFRLATDLAQVPPEQTVYLDDRPLLADWDSMRFITPATGPGRFLSYNWFLQTVQREKSKSMIWVLFAIGAALSWGVYGAMLHRGQMALGNPMRALLCVGMAYFLIGVLAPAATLMSQGALNGFNSQGTTWATVAGGLGAIGALFIILAFKSGGLPTYVMPLVFGGAPVINVLVTMWIHPPKTAPSPMLYLGFLMVAGGAGVVLYFKPPA